MTPDQFTAIRETVRLQGRIQERGSHPKEWPVGLFLFGLPFLAAGAWIGGFGTELVAFEPARIDAPHWLTQGIGGAFVLAGLGLWLGALGQLRLRRERAARRAQHPGRPELVDHPWDPRGESPPRFRPALQAFVGGVAFTAFLVPFHWLAFTKDPDLILKVVLGVFDVALLFLWWEVLRLWIHALKFGASRLEYRAFPYRRGEAVELLWWPPRGVAHIESGRFTLRCIAQWYETTGSGKHRSRSLISEAQWQGVHALTMARDLAPGQPVPLRFEVPADTPPTKLTNEVPVFWELQVELAVPGLDFEASYLVPVY